MNNPKPYFFQSFLIVLLAAVFFLGLKEVMPSKIFPETASTKNVLVDSLLLDAFESEKMTENQAQVDSLASQPIEFSAVDGIVFPKETFQDYKGYQFLIPFYEQLYQLENNPTNNVRIAYFGDSMTDGDMIVQDIRASFQQQFGGKGVGFVPVTSESAASRGSIIHEFSKNWKSQSYLNVKNPIRPFGVSGRVCFANDTTESTWVKFKAGKAKFGNVLHKPTLFYGSTSNSEASVLCQIGKDTIRKKLVSNQLLNTLALSSNDVKSLKVDFKNSGFLPVYGFNFDDGQGVHVDNFSQRGNSGLPITKFNIDLMKAFHQKLNYDLIVLHYGTNVLNYGSKNYNWYERSMTKVVNKLRECFPNTAILIVSTADKATKYETEMKTDSAVVSLTKSQKHYALKNQCGFVNLFTLMGGDGTMVKWVEEEPAMANKDYTHFNFRGSKKVAQMLYDHLNKGYNQYKTLRKNKVPTSVNKMQSKAVSMINTQKINAQ